jgi:hypothetical protein
VSDSDDSKLPPNAFDPDFLGVLRRKDDPPGALEAEMDGEWFVEANPTGGYALYRSWQSRVQGHRPVALFSRIEDALLAAAVRPAAGRDPLFVQDTEPTGDGYFLLRALLSPLRPPAVVGALSHLEDSMLAALNLAAWLARHPLALALILEAGGPTTIQMTGEILHFRLAGSGVE